MADPAAVPMVPGAVILDLTSSYGALLIGSYLAFALWGINALQTYMYYWSYNDDSWVLKLSVAIAMIFDTINKCFFVATSWKVLIQRWGDASALVVNYSGFYHGFWTGYVVIGIVQLYYIRRMMKFAFQPGSYGAARGFVLRVFFFILGFIYFSQFALVIAYVVKVGGAPDAASSENTYRRNMGIAILASDVVLDVAIAVGMLILLKKHDTVYSQTVHMVQRVMMVVVNTGLLTAVVVIVSFTLELAYPDEKLWYSITGWPTCTLYYAGLLANLNARAYVRGDGGLVVTLSNFEAIPPSRITHDAQTHDRTSIQAPHSESLVLRKRTSAQNPNVDGVLRVASTGHGNTVEYGPSTGEEGSTSDLEKPLYHGQATATV